MFRSRPILLHYYITNRCNARCRFCAIWTQKPKMDAVPEEVFRNITAARKQGCRFVDFTGGEPLLHPDLPEFLTVAKKNGFITSVTTNCLLFPDRVEELAGKIDLLHFSLDADTAEMHNEIRGSDSFSKVLASIDLARSHKMVPDLLYTYTDYNIDSFEGVYALARAQRIMVILDPVFAVKGSDILSEDVHQKALHYARRPGVYLNRAHLSLRKTGGNHVQKPLCKAVRSTIVISPDNMRLLPCFHHQSIRLPLTDGLPDNGSIPLADALKKQGTYPFCEACHINCYFDPTYNYLHNRLFFQSLKSKFAYIIMKYLIYGHFKAFLRLCSIL